MDTITCNICGYNGSEFFERGSMVYKCPACGAVLDYGFSSEEKALLSSAQSTLRRQEFDKAEEQFQDIIDRYPANHEAYWGLVCARYGMKYEEDYNGKLIPTCCLDAIDSFKNNNLYRKALSFAPSSVSDWYREQADYVERISKQWMEDARKEAPYDIFICFKDSDKEHGKERTNDSYEAGELYSWLKMQGYRTFFSRISLADKTGEKYEPYIFSALQTAKVLIVFGSRIDYIQSTWMKNEWHRYFKRISLGEKKENSLVVVYKGINPADLPSILSSKQCLDFTSNRFYDDLRQYLDSFFTSSNNNQKENDSNSGIFEENNIGTNSSEPKFTEQFNAKEKKVESGTHKHIFEDKVVKGTCISKGYTLHSCKCGKEYYDSFTPLGEHNFNLTNTIEPTCTNEGHNEYICKTCAEKKGETLPALGHDFSEWVTPGKKYRLKERSCKRCGLTEKRKATENERKLITAPMRKKALTIIIISLVCILTFHGFNRFVFIPNKEYKNAMALFEAGKYKEAHNAFSILDGYKDSRAYYYETEYLEAIELFEADDYKSALFLFKELNDYKDSNLYYDECVLEYNAYLFEKALYHIDKSGYEYAYAFITCLEDNLNGSFYNIEYLEQITLIGDNYNLGENNLKQNYQNAYKWYLEAAKHGYAEAQFDVGLCCYSGNGVQENYAEAVKWFELSANQGYNRAQNQLGLCYYNGIGVSKDYEKAVEWVKKAAKQDYSIAQYHLGNFYEYGIGVTKNINEAKKWYEKSAKQGNQYAQSRLNELQ